MQKTADTGMERHILYFVAGFAAVALGFVILFFGYLLGSAGIMFAGAGLMCIAVAAQSILLLRQSRTRPDEPGPLLEGNNPPGSRVIYADHLVSITEESITFSSYSFPLMTGRQVAFADIDHVTVMKSSVANGRWRIWGSGNLRTWFPLDLHRPSRDRIFIATRKTRGMAIGFTVEDSVRVAAILEDLGLLRYVSHGHGDSPDESRSSGVIR